MPTPLAGNERNYKGYVLSITTRAGEGDSIETLKALTVRTISAWLRIAEQLEKRDYVAKFTGSVESRYVAERNKDTDAPPFELSEKWGEPRVTIWNTYRSKDNGIRFHLNSDDDTQAVIDCWLAQNQALWELDEVMAKLEPQAATTATNSSATPLERPATPKAQNNAPNAVNGGIYTKKDAIAKLAAGDKFQMKVVQIEKHSKDGSDYFEFFEPYGGKAGQFAAVSVFADNEVAQKNGLIDYLNSLNISMKAPLAGEWIVNCVVGKPKTKTIKGEERVVTNIFVNSFVGQPERETGDRSPSMADDLPSGQYDD